MADHKATKKSIRKDSKRRLVNRSRKGILKSKIKDVLKAVEEKNAEKAKEAFFSSVVVIDKMVSTGIIHKNNAARKKSRLWRKVNSLTSTESVG